MFLAGLFLGSLITALTMAVIIGGSSYDDR